MVGGTVNLASRLEHEASPGGVLISFETYALVKDSVRCEEHGHIQVKGIAQPVATYAVIGLNQDRNKPVQHIYGSNWKLTACLETSVRRRRARCVARSGCSKKMSKASIERRFTMRCVPLSWPLGEPAFSEPWRARFAEGISNYFPTTSNGRLRWQFSTYESGSPL